jgi:hypothetical protein
MGRNVGSSCSRCRSVLGEDSRRHRGRVACIEPCILLICQEVKEWFPSLNTTREVGVPSEVATMLESFHNFLPVRCEKQARCLTSLLLWMLRLTPNNGSLLLESPHT